MVGQILGKALYEGMLLDVPLAPFFLLQLQGRTLMFDDLFSLDPELHKNLLQVLTVIAAICLGCAPFHNSDMHRACVYGR